VAAETREIAELLRRRLTELALQLERREQRLREIEHGIEILGDRC
jgi:hypothetical protein